MKQETELCLDCQQPMEREIIRRRYRLFFCEEIEVWHCHNENCPNGRLSLTYEAWQKASGEYEELKAKQYIEGL